MSISSKDFFFKLKEEIEVIESYSIFRLKVKIEAIN